MKIALILSSVFLNALAQLFMRKGMLIIGNVQINKILFFLPQMAKNIYILSSMFCYAISIILWMVVLSKVEVSFAYPFLSVGYVITIISGYLLFNESLSVYKIIGVVVICLGVFILSKQ